MRRRCQRITSVLEYIELRRANACEVAIRRTLPSTDRKRARCSESIAGLHARSIKSLLAKQEFQSTRLQETSLLFDLGHPPPPVLEYLSDLYIDPMLLSSLYQTE